MPLTCPGTTTSALALAVPASAATGADALDPQFHAILCQAKVKKEHMVLLGNNDCDSTAVFGHIAKDEEKFALYLKRVLNVDPEARPEDSVPSARLHIAWATCKKRCEVEVEVAAQRAVNRMPVQLAVDDYQSTREAWERSRNKFLPDHKVPSENYFERKVGEMETCLKPEKLSEVTNKAQEEQQKTPNAHPGTYQDFDSAGRGILKTQKKDFYVQLPNDEASLRNRFDVMGAMYEMLKMKFMANPMLASASLQTMKDYVDWLCGENVWGFVVMGPDGKPSTCPHIGIVRNYDQAIRNLQHRLIKAGKPFEEALELAMNDSDTRTLHFTTPFGMEAKTPACMALTAPGLKEVYGAALKQPAQPKRPAPSEEFPLMAIEKSPQAKKRARTKANKAAAAAAGKGAGKQAALPAIAAHPPPLALADVERPPRGAKGGAKGAKGAGKAAGKGGIPSGIKPRHNNKPVCYAFNKGEVCVMPQCTMEHVCWWCHGSHAGGMAKTAACGA
jgi:hypothetical protein